MIPINSEIHSVYSHNLLPTVSENRNNDSFSNKLDGLKQLVTHQFCVELKLRILVRIKKFFHF